MLNLPLRNCLEYIFGIELKLTFFVQFFVFNCSTLRVFFFSFSFTFLYFLFSFFCFCFEHLKNHIASNICKISFFSFLFLHVHLFSFLHFISIDFLFSFLFLIFQLFVFFLFLLRFCIFFFLFYRFRFCFKSLESHCI